MFAEWHNDYASVTEAPQVSLRAALEGFVDEAEGSVLLD